VKKILAGFVLLSLVCAASCSLPIKHGGIRQEETNSETQLMKIRIKQWGNTRFSGLLVLLNHSTEVYYILLDATGVKLIEARVKKNGDYEIIRASGPVKDTQMPNFLAKSLQKIYLIEPHTVPCSRNMLLWLCLEEYADQHMIKYARAGPFTIWSVDYKYANNLTSWHEASMSIPWLGVKLILIRVNYSDKEMEKP
jgi:hypothetical protein